MRTLIEYVATLSLAALFWLLPVMAVVMALMGEMSAVEDIILYWFCDLLLIGIVAVFAA